MNLKLDPDARKEAIAKLQQFFRDERDEELGELAASLLLERIETDLAPHFFNLGVRAAKGRLRELWDGADEALELLEQRPPRGKR
jgi:uncharacterized protein (DUF2164 family)